MKFSASRLFPFGIALAILLMIAWLTVSLLDLMISEYPTPEYDRDAVMFNAKTPSSKSMHVEESPASR